MSNVQKIVELRRKLAEAQIAERASQDVYKVAKAESEQRAIEAAGGDKALGSNAEARDRALTIALDLDDIYQAALSRVRDTEAARIRAEAELEAEKDIRRDAEWEAKERLFRALDYITAKDREEMAEAMAAGDDEFSIVAEVLAEDTGSGVAIEGLGLRHDDEPDADDPF